MYIDGDEIRLDAQQDRMNVAEDDWVINRGEHIMRHLPTTIVFQIGMDEEAEKAGQGTVFNLVARPVHIGSGQQLPVPTAMTELGRAAIVLYVQVSGLLDPQRQPENGTPTCEPDLNVN